MVGIGVDGLRVEPERLGRAPLLVVRQRLLEAAIGRVHGRACAIRARGGPATGCRPMDKRDAAMPHSAAAGGGERDGRVAL